MFQNPKGMEIYDSLSPVSSSGAEGSEVFAHSNQWQVPVAVWRRAGEKGGQSQQLPAQLSELELQTCGKTRGL